jgi:hypothetical protein
LPQSFTSWCFGSSDSTVFSGHGYARFPPSSGVVRSSVAGNATHYHLLHGFFNASAGKTCVAISIGILRVGQAYFSTLTFIFNFQCRNN